MNTAGLKTEKVLYEFEGFRVDPVRRRILRAGEPVPLTPKAFSILLVLLERRGEVVEKEELIQRVWPDTYVTEANLTQNISSLRKALGERAHDSRFVVTVPGQGYSFVADVLEVSRDSTAELSLASLVPPSAQPPPAAAPAAPAPAQEAPQEGVQEAPVRGGPAAAPAATAADAAAPLPEAARQEGLTTPADATGAYPLHRRRGLYVAGVVLLVLAALAVPLILLKMRAQPALPGAAAADRRSIAVLPLRNLTGNPDDDWLATALAEMMTTELEADSRLRVVSGSNVSRAQRSVTNASRSRDLEAPANLRKLRLLIGADLVVSGSYSILGEGEDGQVRLDLRVFDAQSGDIVAALPESGNQQQLFDLVSRAGSKLRSSLGWSTLSPEQARAAQAQRLSSTEAARLYARGLEHLRAFDAEGARDLLQEAAEADPTSARIRSALSQAWAELGYDVESTEDAIKARELATNLPRPERLAIEARYHQARREWLQAADIYRSLWTFFPDDLEYGLRLAEVLTTAGRSAEARLVIEELRRLPAPEGEDPRIDLSEAQVAKRMADYEAQTEAADRALAKGRSLAEDQIVAQALSLKGDALLLSGRPKDAMPLYDESQRLFRQAGNRLAGERLLTRIGFAQMQMSQLAEARKMFDLALEGAQRTGNTIGIALQQANLGLLNIELGDMRAARELLEQAHRRFNTAGDRVYEEQTLHALGLALLAQGDFAGAEKRFQMVRALTRQTGNRTDLLMSLEQLGVIKARQGALGEALRLQNQALAMARSLDHQARTAGVLLSSAATLAALGETAKSRQRYNEALNLGRTSGSRQYIGRAYGGLSRLAYTQGDLAAARRLAENELYMARETGSRSLDALARADLARIFLAAGDLAAAQRSLDDALRTATSLGQELDAAAIRLDLARVSLAQEQPQAAAARAREAADWFGQRKLEPDEARALALLAEALLREGRLAEAQEVASRLRSRAENTQDLELRIIVALQTARVGASTGEVGAAFMKMRQAEETASKAGFVAPGLEARLVLGLFQLDRLDRIAGRKTLESLQRDAQTRGFHRLARQAAAALEDHRLPNPPVAGR